MRVIWTLVTKAMVALALCAVGLVQPDRPAGASTATFAPSAPWRAMDSRNTAPFSSGEIRSLELTAIPPSSGAAALNVTVIGGDVATYVTVWPGGTAQPWASNVNVPPRGTVANMVLTGVTNRTINIRNEAGAAHVIVDVVGHFDGTFSGTSPTRVLDTRIGQGAAPQRVGLQPIEVDVRTPASIPPTATALAVNITATDASQATYVTAWPAGGSIPPTSNLNVAPGQTVANLAVIGLPASGRISLLNGAGQVHLVADVFGWFEGSSYVALPPNRLMDTRLRSCGFSLGPGEERRLTVTGAGGVPTGGVSAVAVNVTAVEPNAGGYLSVYPAGTPTPNASTLNFAAGQTVPNAAIVGVGAGGQIAVFNPAGRVHVIVDVFGYFGGAPVVAGAPVACPIEVPPPPPPAVFGDGTWRVNVDIPPGRYVLGSSSNCYWKRVAGFSGALEEIIANDFVISGRIVVDIAGSDAGFVSSRCGVWQQFFPSPTPAPATGFGTGTYVVGQDIYAGLYSAPGGSSCYWKRLTGFGGSFEEIIGNDFGSVNPVVRIALSDVGFHTSDCGTWTRLGD